MADKLNSLVPVIFNRFKSECDLENVDVEDLNKEVLAKTTNLTANRKIGSLKMFGGTSLATLPNGASMNLPNPSGYNLIDFYSFSVDRDNKEITILIYENSSGETRIYINPYYNPESTFSNYNPNKSTGWIYEWLELTENYASNEIATIPTPTGYVITLATALSKTDDYFNGWFIVNEDLANTDMSKFNFVTDYDDSSVEFTLKMAVTNWLDTHSVRLFRFPVGYLYNAITPNPTYPDYTNAGTTFKGKPTQFFYSQNQLRMPCGKELRPLILDLIYKRKYFQGSNETVGESVASVTLTGSSTALTVVAPIVTFTGGGGSGATAYIDTLKVGAITSINDAGSNFIVGDVCRTAVNTGIQLEVATFTVSSVDGSGGITGISLTTNGVFSDFPTNPVDIVRISNTGIEVDSAPNARLNLTWAANSIRVTNPGSGYTSAPTVVFTPSTSMSGTAVLSVAVASEISYDGFWFDFQQPQQVLYNANINHTIVAANGGVANRVSHNLFLGTSCTVALETVYSRTYNFILTCVIDSRNEVIVATGETIYGNQTIANLLTIKFNSWFTRRLTHIQLYRSVGQSNLTAVDPAYPINEYPYASFSKDVNINNLPSEKLRSIYNILAPINGENPRGSGDPTPNSSNGINTYTLSNNAFFTWYTRLGFQDSTYGEIPTGLTFTANTNRFVDEDVTMNYTRISKLGEVNGRYFVIGSKNTIELENYESDDFINYNTLASGVSAYDIFQRNNSLAINVGDKDINRALEIYNGYLFNIKDTNVFLVDISSDSELSFRVIKTDVGRGVTSPNSICYTPHGIVMASSDSVYLLNPNGGTRPILNAFNGRLEWYRTYFANQLIDAVYYNSYDELFLIQTSTGPTVANYIMVYNFQNDNWTTIEHNGSIRANVTAYLKARTNASRQVLLANVNTTTNACNIVKFDETAFTYLNTVGNAETLNWTIQTHLMPIANKLKDMLIQAVQFHFDYSNSANRNITLTIIRNGNSDDTYTLVFDSTSSVNTFNKTFTQLIKDFAASDQISVKLSNTNQEIKFFNLNSFVIWLTEQPRQLRQGLI